MPLSPALSERFHEVQELEGSRYVARYLVTGDDGAPAELLVLKTPAIHPPAVRAGFAELHRRLSRAAHDSVIETLEVGEVEGSPFVLRRALDPTPLGELTTPLPPEIVAAMGAALVPAVLVAGAATDGSVRLEDLGVDQQGKVVLAPLGRLPGDVTLERAWSAAPEVFSGGTVDGDAGLYGLGLALYQLTTGVQPYPSGQRSDARTGPVPRAASVRPGIPAALDDALAALMSPEPRRRREAEALFSQLAAEDYDLRKHRKLVTSAPERVPPTRSAPVTSRGREADAPAAVVIPASVLTRLDAAEQSRAAGAAGLSVGELQQLVTQGLPLVLDTLPSARAAAARARTLAAETGLPVEAARGASFWRIPAVGLVVLLGLALTTALALGLGFVGTTLALVSVAVTLSLTALAAGGLWWAGRPRHLPQARQAMRLRQRVEGAEQVIRTRIAELRTLLPQLDLPEPAAVDVRGALRDVERQMEGLLAARASLDAASTGTSLADLRAQHQVQSRAAHRSEQAVRERDRLARAIADLEHVEQTREQLERRIERLSTSLDEIGAVMARLRSSSAASDLESLDRALDGLGATVRLVTESVSDANSTRSAAADRERE